MRNRPWPGTLTAAFCLLLAGAANAQQPAPTNLEGVVVSGKKGDLSAWDRVESQHFIVYSDVNQEDVLLLLDNLEKLDHLLRIYTQPIRQTEQQEPKLTLYYHSRASQLREIDAGTPANAMGLYSSCAAGVQGFGVHLERIPDLRDAQLDKAPLNNSLSYVFEAYARHFLYRHTDIRTPAWFMDGFAQYFSTVRFSAQQMVVGRVPTAIGGYLKFLDDGTMYSLDYDDVLQNKLANAHNHGGEAGVRLEFAAKSWLMTHYMLSSGDKRKRLSRYLLLTERGMSPTAAFERAFGMKTDALRSAMWRYGRRGMEALRVAVPALPAAKVRLRSLPKAAGEFVLAEAALKSCPGRPAGESLLKQVAGLAERFPDDELARLTLSRAQIDWGNAQDALPALNALLQQDDAHFEARYLLGLANLRLAERSAGEERRSHLLAALSHLQRARGLNPQSPEAAIAAFEVEVAATSAPGDAALAAVIAAWKTARDVDTLARSAALAYAYTGNANEAQQTLASLALNAHDKPMAQWAAQWQSRLEAGVTRGDILAEMRRAPAPNGSYKEWTIDKEDVLQKVKVAYGLGAASSFIKEQQKASDGPRPSPAATPDGPKNR